MIIIQTQCSVPLFNIHMRPNRKPLRHGLRCSITVVVCVWEGNATQSMNAFGEETCFANIKIVYCFTDPFVCSLHSNVKFHVRWQMWGHNSPHSSQVIWNALKTLWETRWSQHMIINSPSPHHFLVILPDLFQEHDS